LEQQREEDLKRLLQAEAALLLLLRRRSKKALRRRVDAAIRADELYRSVRQSVIEGRRVAAAAARYRTIQNLRLVGVSVEVSERAVLQALAKRDELAASRAGHGVTSRWLTGQLVDPDTAPRARPKPFDLEFELGRTAASEAVDAFIEARNEVLARLPDRVAEQLLKRWQSMGDDRVCATCEQLDGEEVPVREEFPMGDAPIHPGCRCTFTVISISEATAA